MERGMGMGRGGEREGGVWEANSVEVRTYQGPLFASFGGAQRRGRGLSSTRFVSEEERGGEEEGRTTRTNKRF